MVKRDVVSPEGFRGDGRRANELRRIECEIGGGDFSGGGGDGAAYVAQGNSRCLVTVVGPKEPENRSRQVHDRANIEVVFSMASFSSGERRQQLKKDKLRILPAFNYLLVITCSSKYRRLLELASVVKSTFESAIITSSYPRSEITIEIQILQFDGGALPLAINATTLALMNAGIPMYDYVVAASAGFGSNTPILDVNYTEEGLDVPVVTVGVMPRSGKVVLLNLESRLHLDEFEKVLTLAKDGCTQMYQVLDEAVRANAEALAR
ncbi:Exosome complex component RRP41 [Rhizoclosmatium sp. JEL0117]|nr:Exosome complex component RRP41 [Rhizoclosmatium sp. JEL0117]